MDGWMDGCGWCDLTDGLMQGGGSQGLLIGAEHAYTIGVGIPMAQHIHARGPSSRTKVGGGRGKEDGCAVAGSVIDGRFEG